MEKSSLVLDICWMNVPFDVMSFQKNLRFFFNECCENTLKTRLSSIESQPKKVVVVVVVVIIVGHKT